MRARDTQGRQVELTKIAGECKQDDCAAVSLTDRGTAAVQGYPLYAETPDGEGVLELPIEMLLEAARALLR
jgi:hypothetical protein